MAALVVEACVWLAWRRRWAQMLLVASATAGAAVAVLVLKTLVGRPRPLVADHLVTEIKASKTPAPRHCPKRLWTIDQVRSSAGISATARPVPRL
jgi:hypothetical protein